MKKLLPGILALLMAFGCMTACGQTPDASTPGGSTPPASTPGDSTPEAPKHQHETDLADVKDYLLEQFAKKNFETRKDFTLPSSFNFIGDTTKYAIAWTSNVAAVTIEAGETEATVKIGEVSEDTPFVLTATVTDPDGCHTTTLTVEGVALKALDMIPVAITEKPAENVAYKLHVYQKTLAKDLYFNGNDKAATYYFGTTENFEEGVDMYVQYIEGTETFYVYFTDADNVKKYVGVRLSDDGAHDNIVLTTEPISVFKWNTELQTITTTLEKNKEGNSADYYLGNYSNKDTISASMLSYASTSNVGGLVVMTDKNNVVIPASKKVADVKASLSIGTQYTLDKEIELTVADERYDDVTITWAVEGAGATIADGKLSLTIPAEKATVTLTATIACGETTDTKEFTLELGPKTVVPEDKTDAAAIVAAAYNLAAGETLPGGTYTLTGEIKEVNKAWDAGYSNITVTITVGDKTFECYRLKSGDADASVLKVGDTITVSGTIKNYNGKVEFDAGCILDAVVAGETPDVPDEPVVNETALITSAPVETSVYKYFVYQSTTKQNLYFTGEVERSYYFSTTETYAEAVELYVEYVNETNFNLFFMKDGARQYVGVTESWNSSKSKWAYNATVSAEPVSTFVYDATVGSIVTTIAAHSANDQSSAVDTEKSFYIGTYSNYTTLSASATSYAGGEGNNVGGLVDTGKTVETLPGATETPEEPTPDPEPDEPDVPVATENKADFNTIEGDGYGQYDKTFTTANGWTTVNSALQVGGPSVANPAYPVIGADKTFKAVCLNGKTSAPGKLTSPTLKGGISVLNLKYTKMFTDTKLGALITITDIATGTTYTATLTKEADKNDKYSVWTYEWVLETAITGDFTIEIVNTCPTGQDGNKDRLTILELSWIATAGGETPDTPDTPVEPEEPETPDVPEIQTLTIAEAIAKATEMGAGNYTTEMYYITGKITEVQNSTYGNVMISDGTNEILVYGMYTNNNGAKGDRYDAMAKKPIAGDTVKLLSVVGMFNTTQQLKDALLVEITDATDAEKVAIEKDALTVSDSVDGAASIALPANGASRVDVTFAWEVTAGSEIASIADGKLVITNPTAETTVTVKATITCGESIDSKTFDIVVTPTVAGTEIRTTFEFGANAGATHVDGNDIGASKTYTEGAYVLALTDVSKTYDGAKDAKGNSCLKLGTSKLNGSFTFTVPANVTQVIIKVAKYKANNTTVSVNGTTHTISGSSNDGAYDEITIDTTTTKTITFATAGSTYRCMVNSITFVATAA